MWCATVSFVGASFATTHVFASSSLLAESSCLVVARRARTRAMASVCAAAAKTVHAMWELVTSEDGGDDNLCVHYIDASRGFGMFATRRMCEGEQIFVEVPLLTVTLGVDAVQLDRDGKRLLADALTSTLESRSESERSRFYELSLASCHEHEPQSLGIFLTNGMNTGGAGSVFALVSRINHSCSPNVLHCWNELHGELTLHAACDIEMGTELTIAYNETAGAMHAPREERREHLRKNFGFECECELCGSSEDYTSLVAMREAVRGTSKPR